MLPPPGLPGVGGVPGIDIEASLAGRLPRGRRPAGGGPDGGLGSKARGLPASEGSMRRLVADRRRRREARNSGALSALKAEGVPHSKGSRGPLSGRRRRCRQCRSCHQSPRRCMCVRCGLPAMFTLLVKVLALEESLGPGHSIGAKGRQLEHEVGIVISGASHAETKHGAQTITASPGRPGRCRLVPGRGGISIDNACKRGGRGGQKPGAMWQAGVSRRPPRPPPPVALLRPVSKSGPRRGPGAHGSPQPPRFAEVGGHMVQVHKSGQPWSMSGQVCPGQVCRGQLCSMP